MPSFERLLPSIVLPFVLGCEAPISESVAVTEQPVLGGEMARAGAWTNVLWLSSGCTATLVHESLILFAAHCGVDHEEVWSGEDFGAELGADAAIVRFDREGGQAVPIERCMEHPDARSSPSVDLAFCVLAEPMPDIPIASPAMGCERDQVTPGAEAMLVGFGLDAAEGGSFGKKRIATAKIQTVEPEFIIGNYAIGTCRGDSGGPAFVSVAPEGAAPDWRLEAVLSAGERGRCGFGVYTEVAGFVDWIETNSGFDISPCTDATGKWRPTEACQRVPLDGDGVLTEAEHAFSDSCGRPFTTTLPPDCATSRPGSGLGGARAAWLAAIGLLLIRRGRRHG